MYKLLFMYLFLFITLYMFRAHRAHHQERQIVSIQPLVTVIAVSNPAEAVGFFGRPENPHYAFLRRGSKIMSHYGFASKIHW